MTAESLLTLPHFNKVLSRQLPDHSLHLQIEQRGDHLGSGDIFSAFKQIVQVNRTEALDASRALEAEGFLVVAIRPPTVPAGEARLRIAFSAEHPDAEIARLAALVKPYVKAAD